MFFRPDATQHDLPALIAMSGTGVVEMMQKIETGAQTEALRQVLAHPLPSSAVADFLFLEAWERDPSDKPGVALRVGQIRRANPSLAAAIRAEISDSRRRGSPNPARQTVALPIKMSLD